jgi:hypothetical protein
MKGPMIGYGCFLTTPLTLPDTPTPIRDWQWQPYADFEIWWNDQPAAHVGFPLLFGGIDTPEYLVLVIGAGETDARDQRTHPSLRMLGNFAIPLDHLATSLGKCMTQTTLRQAEEAWEKVVAQAEARGLILERQAILVFIYEQDLCGDP